ncbi:membrane protein [Candidatus Methylomirabilis lanthanidiphila]|uniref:Membrane protein n=1 Tax=Candidatus Methylomirabilis lanthanidiphila TaxID=2211376 RepID=A0A564ZJ30_9BACT|nr:RDD family protein [Candidatus Methylomirabilis lanthanidiphila]VUZ85351.1 membrane protein [Candidatus Methylomirabilis lanthanidiphila]
MGSVECCDSAAPVDSAQIVAEPPDRKAGFWIRLAAWNVDLACLFLVTTALTFVALTVIYVGGQLGGEINDQVIALAGYTSGAIVLFSGVAYFTIFIGSCGQTPGKMLFRLKVIRGGGREMTYGRALIRSLGWMLSLLLFGLGFLAIACTRHKRALHDMLAGTSVIRLPRTP